MPRPKKSASKGDGTPKKFKGDKFKLTRQNQPQALMKFFAVGAVVGIAMTEAANALQRMPSAKHVEEKAIIRRSVCQQEEKNQRYQL